MAEDVVVKESLSEAMIKAGSELTRKLDELKWPVIASLWFYFPEENQWRLIFASPEVKKEGPKKAYKHVQEALSKLPENTPQTDLRDIAVVDAEHPLISLLRLAVSTGDGISGIRFSRNVINGHLIEDAYIYRIK